MQKKDKDLLLKDVTSLLNISDNVARSIYHKVEELKDRYSDDLLVYEQAVKIMKPVTLQAFKFEMIRKNGSWRVSIPGYPASENGIIPHEIAAHITKSGINADVIEMVKNFETSDKKRYDFSFEKKTDDRISCTISEQLDTEEKLTVSHESKIGKSQVEKSSKLEELITYMMNDEDFFNFMIDEFSLKWKPLLTDGCISKKISAM